MEKKNFNPTTLRVYFSIVIFTKRLLHKNFTFIIINSLKYLARDFISTEIRLFFMRTRDISYVCKG